MVAAETMLVVGADGMIGRALAERLVKGGHDVVCTVRTHGDRRPEQAPRSSGDWPSSKQLSELRGACSGLRVLELDLARDAADWRPPAANVAFLCAAVTSQEKCRAQPKVTRAVNVAGTLALAERFMQQGTHVIFPSTNLVLSGEKPHQAADEPYAPQSEYARQKVEVEQRLRQFPRACIVRFTKVVDRGNRLLGDWCESLQRGGAIHPFSNMPFAPVTLDFAVRSLIAVAAVRAEGIVQVSATEDITYAAAGSFVANRLNVAAELVRPVAVSRAIEHMPRNTSLDSTRLRTEFGLAPPCPWDAIELGMQT